MDIGTLFGLPAHPLLMHIPVLGIPLCALWVVIVVARPAWRARMTVPLAVFTIVIMAFTILTANAGEELEHQVERNDLVRRHAELGDQTRTLVIIFSLVTLGYLLLDWWHRKNRVTNATGKEVLPTPAWQKAILGMGIIAVLLGGTATVWDVRTGHSGAKATWSDVGETAAEPDGDGS